MTSPRARVIQRSDNRSPTGAEESQLRSIIEQEETIVNILKRQQRERTEQLDHALQSGAALDESLHTISDLLAEGVEVKERVTKFATRVDCVLNTQAQAQSYLESGGQVKWAIEAIKPSLPGLLEQLDIISSVTPSIVCRLQTELEVQGAIASNAQSSLRTLEVVITALLDSLQDKRIILQPEVLELVFIFAVQCERLDIHAKFPQYNHRVRSSSSCLPAVSYTAASIWGTCRRWRAIAMALPYLWSYLEFNFDHVWYESTDLEYALSLSREYQLEVDIYAPRHNHSRGLLSMLPLSRLESVTFIHMNLLPSSFPSAKTVRLVGCRDNVGLRRCNTIHFPSQVLSNTSELVCFDIIPLLDTTSIQTLKVHWTETVLVSLPDFYTLLERFPTLTHLGVMCGWSVTLTELMIMATPLPSISVLSLTPSAFWPLDGMIEHGCQLPSLIQFIVRGDPDGRRCKPYPSLFRALYPVEHFELQADEDTSMSTSTRSERLRELLDAMPSLRIVTLTGDIVPHGIRALMVEPVRRIEKLVVIGSKTDGCAIQAYSKAVENVAVEGKSQMVVSLIDCPYVLSEVLQGLGL